MGVPETPAERRANDLANGQLSTIGELVNMLMDAGYRIDWPGMWCPDHLAGRICGLYRIGQPIPVAVIPCSESPDAVIERAADMVTYPGGIDAWFAKQYKEVQ